MIEDMFVIDATTHAYNLSDANLVGDGRVPSRYAHVFREVLFGLQARGNAAEAVLPREMFYTDWAPETLAHTLFTESDVDVAGHHRLRLDSLFVDGLCSAGKNRLLAETWPRRFLIYAGVNPLDGVQTCVRDLRDQVDRVPSTVGLKLYPDTGDPARSWRLDDPRFGALFEAATELGLKTIAVHKIVPNGLTPLAPYRIDDLEAVAIAYPQLAFEIVHAGLPPFVDEVALALMRLPNVYANLEITSALLARGLGRVRDALAQFFSVGAAHKILFASGGLHFHPQPVIEYLAHLSFPEHVLEYYRIDQVTPEQRAGILGGNYARMIGLDPDAAARAVADDEFARSRADGGRRPLWSYWRDTARDRGFVPA